MTNKTFAATIITVVLVATGWLGLLVGGRAGSVLAAQCWEPGCCGFSLVFNQWSCQSAQNYQMCYDMGEAPAWVCSNGGVYINESQCNSACSGGTCQLDCPISGWGNTCVITSGSENCIHPDADTCTATIYAQQCSSMGGAVNDCTQYTGSIGDVRDCWVGAVDPTPVPGSSCFGCSQPSGGFCMWYEGNCPSWGGNCNACQAQPEPPTPTPTPNFGPLSGVIKHRRTDVGGNHSYHNIRCGDTMYVPQPQIGWQRLPSGPSGTINYPNCTGYPATNLTMGNYRFTLDDMGNGSLVDGWQLVGVDGLQNVTCNMGTLNNTARSIECSVNSWSTNRLNFLVAANPRGRHAGPSSAYDRCEYVTGWSCDPDDFGRPNFVDIHSSNGLITSISSNNSNEWSAETATHCNSGWRSFNYRFSDANAAARGLWNGNNVTIYVRGRNLPSSGGSDVNLNTSYTINCNDYSVSGTVYNRHSSSGLYNLTLGICSGATAGVYGGGTVRLYNASNVLVGQAAVAGNGTYTIRTGTRTAGTYRLELVGLPDPYVCGCETSLNDDYQCVYNSLKVDNLLSHCNDFGCTANFYVEPTFTVSGTVREGEAEGAYCASQMANRGPVAGATVRTTVPMLGNEARQSVSDANGVYSFERLRYATYNLSIDMPPPLPEYYPFCPRTGNQDVSVTTADVPNVDFYLSTFKISETVYDKLGPAWER